MFNSSQKKKTDILCYTLIMLESMVMVHEGPEETSESHIKPNLQPVILSLIWLSSIHPDSIDRNKRQTSPSRYNSCL